MRIRPYRLYGRTALESLELAARRLLQDWVDAWEMPGAGLSLTVTGPGESAEGDGPEPVLLHEPDSERWVLFVHGKELFESIAGLLLHDGRVRPRQGSLEDALAADVVMQALADLARRFSGSRVCGRLGGSTMRQFVSPVMRQPGSGILRLRLGIADCAVDMWVSPGVAHSLAASGITQDRERDAHSLTPAGKALGGQRVPVQVILGNAELTLDALGSLQAGDVIRLDVNLSEPLLVAFAESGAACKGFLGQKNGNLAVQIDSVFDL